ncbi:MAG: aminodeoxychorismate lyase [Gallionellaceae bacterium]
MTTLINGSPSDTISVTDRGLLYGDGVFRTFALKNILINQWHRHYAKLVHDCHAINLPCPSGSLLQSEIASLTQNTPSAAIKITITRGMSQRGYTPAASPQVTRIISVSPLPDYPELFYQAGVRVHLCQLRLGHQPRLAGIKHLNRLENVMAAAEWSDPDIAEGILLDQSGNVIEGVRSNLFMLKQGVLFTPDLTQCGVAGVQRERIIAWAEQQGIVCKIQEISLEQLQQAEEIFLVNSIIGLWPVREMPGYQCNYHPMAHAIKAWLDNEIL